MANQTITSPTGGAIPGLVVDYASVIKLDRSPIIHRQILPTITTIFAPNVSIPDVKKASC